MLQNGYEDQDAVEAMHMFYIADAGPECMAISVNMHTRCQLQLQ